jgi:cytidine deaminase
MDPELFGAAKEVRDHAYAPFSGYKVGAALRSTSGRIFVGCNVENISYGLTVCAERNAIGAMVAAGDREFTEIVVVTDDIGSPCGMCRQVLVEFSPGLKATVNLASDDGEHTSIPLANLLPYPFKSDKVHRSK